MPRIVVETEIAAPPERCFDLARSIDFHVRRSVRTGERAVAGVTAGLIGPGERVTWSARHLGVRQRLAVRIVEYDRPRVFVDEMERGAFRSFRHRHEFSPLPGGRTLMRDVLDYEAPLGPLGRLAERLVVTPHLRRFKLDHAAQLKRAAESDAWRAFAPDA